jgi:hypothetical protein
MKILYTMVPNISVSGAIQIIKGTFTLQSDLPLVGAPSLASLDTDEQLYGMSFIMRPVTNA